MTNDQSSDSCHEFVVILTVCDWENNFMSNDHWWILFNLFQLVGYMFNHVIDQIGIAEK